jgi:hypothetical protein
MLKFKKNLAFSAHVKRGAQVPLASQSQTVGNIAGAAAERGEKVAELEASLTLKAQVNSVYKQS